MAREVGDAVAFERRAFLLLPGEGQRPVYDEYVISHRRRAAEMAPELGFAIPQPGHPYPRSSLPAQLVVFKHAFRNALIPAITIWGLQIGYLLGGAFVIENVFAWPGIGRLAVQSVFCARCGA